jgi:hypothetical protein
MDRPITKGGDYAIALSANLPTKLTGASARILVGDWLWLAVVQSGSSRPKSVS